APPAAAAAPVPATPHPDSASSRASNGHMRPMAIKCTRPVLWRKGGCDRGILLRMPRPTPSTRRPAEAQPSRVRRGYFECRYGQLHVHNSMPPGGGFEEGSPLLCLHDMAGSAWAFAHFMTLAGQERSVY